MADTVLVYASKRQRTRLRRQGFELLAEYEDYVLTRATGEQVELLRESGYEVEIYRARPPRGPAFEAAGSVAAEPAHDPGPSTYGPGEHYYLVNFIGPVKPEWLKEIEQHGGRLQNPEPPHGYVVALDDPAYEWATQTGYIEEVRHYGASHRISPDLKETLRNDRLPRRGVQGEAAAGDRLPASVERIPNAFTVRFFQAEDLVQALPRINEMGATPSEPQPGGKVITVTFDPQSSDMQGHVDQLAALHGVRSIEPCVLRQLRNNIAAGLMAAEEVQDPSGLGLSGRGEIVSVADSGLDTGDPATIHPDFAGRIAALFSWPVTSEWASVVTNAGGDDGPADARSGHGTHVTGSLAGSGAGWSPANPGEGGVRGIAWEASIVFQAIEQRLDWTDSYRQSYFRQYRRYPPESGLAGLPADLRLLFEQAYDEGARIHSDSWGGGMYGAYDHYSEAVDRFTWDHKDFLILMSAGNDGTDEDGDGIVESGSVTPPGTAKNAITVGAAESVRAEGGYQRAYGSLWPASFGAAPLKGDLPSDHPDDIAAFSSRGPTRDGRIKPDLVAPGTNILSARSTLLQGPTFGWGPFQESDRYMFNGGTSMATPLVAGAAALVREFLRKVKRRAQPSAALIKATLIHGAGYRAYRHEPAGPGPYDWSQGWGHVDLGRSLVPEGTTNIRWYDQRRGLGTGQSWRWSCTVNDTSAPLAFTLAWTDFPGSPSTYPNLVNDLDLVITSPSGAMIYGNTPSGEPGGAPDRVNNVERVVIPEPEAGRYRIRVRAFNVPSGPQDFALVYSGGLA